MFVSEVILAKREGNIHMRLHSFALWDNRDCVYVLLCFLVSYVCKLFYCMFLYHSVMAQKSREGNRDLQIQLDQALQQAQDPNSKGNSLFAEVKTNPVYQKSGTTCTKMFGIQGTTQESKWKIDPVKSVNVFTLCISAGG